MGAFVAIRIVDLLLGDLKPHLFCVAQDACAPVFENHYIFDSDTAPFGNVDARFNREGHSVFEWCEHHVARRSVLHAPQAPVHGPCCDQTYLRIQHRR